MKTKKPKRGRPKLNIKSDRIKITVDVSPATHAQMAALRGESGLSFGRLIDKGISSL